MKIFSLPTGSRFSRVNEEIESSFTHTYRIIPVKQNHVDQGWIMWFFQKCPVHLQPRFWFYIVADTSWTYTGFMKRVLMNVLFCINSPWSKFQLRQLWMLRLQRVRVFFFQVLGFEVDSINSVQFSNHTGKMVQTFHIGTFWVACASRVPLRWFSYRREDRLILFYLLFIVYWIFKLLLWDILKCLCAVFVCLRGCVCVSVSQIFWCHDEGTV